MILVDATLAGYIRWINRALDIGNLPQYYCNYPMPRMACAIQNFTMDGERGARAVDILVCKDVSYSGDVGHNRLYLSNGTMVNNGYTIYSNREFEEIPGMLEFKRAEQRRAELELAEQEYRYRMEDFRMSDIRIWREN